MNKYEHRRRVNKFLRAQHRQLRSQCKTLRRLRALNRRVPPYLVGKPWVRWWRLLPREQEQR